MNIYQHEHRGFIIKPHKTFPSNYVIVTEGQGGKIPDVLSGMFTRKDIGVKEIDKYLDTKEVVNDKARKSSRG